MPRLVRRRPLSERLKEYLNPYDLWIWISEEIETSDYPWEQWAYIFGVACNFVFILAKSNSKYRSIDDVFGDENDGNVLITFAIVVTYTLVIASLTNAVYTFMRKRHYRMFERPVESAAPSTPSARRVRVDSSPVSSSPLRFLASLINDDSASAQSRAHADTKRDVWEIAVWDPTPVNLRFFCTFSPGHVLLYWLFIPVSSTDPRPSTTIATAMFLAALLSAQLVVMQHLFTQQAKDSAYVQQEVMNEYNTKFVHPATQPVMRDVGIQFDEDYQALNSIEVSTPRTIVNRGFRPNPNPNYTGLVDPDHAMQTTPTRPVQTFQGLAAVRSPNAFTPTPAVGRGSKLRHSVGPVGDGGNLGVYTHARSPLKNAQNASGRHDASTGTPERALHKRVTMSTMPNEWKSPRPSMLR